MAGLAKRCPSHERARGPLRVAGVLGRQLRIGLELEGPDGEIVELATGLVDPGRAFAGQQRRLQELRGGAGVRPGLAMLTAGKGLLGGLHVGLGRLDVDPRARGQLEPDLGAALERIGAEHPAHGGQEHPQGGVALTLLGLRPEGGDQLLPAHRPSTIEHQERGQRSCLPTLQTILNGDAAIADAKATAKP